MNTKKKAAAATLGVLAVLVLLAAYPAVAASAAPPQNSPQRLMQNSSRMSSQRINLSVGQTINLTSVAGGYWVVGDRGTNGTAAGSMTLQVTGNLTGGYAISISGGSLNINGTTYAISGGSAELGPHGRLIVGQGDAGTAQFLFHGRNLGKFGTTDYGIVRVDLQSGSSEFAVRLLVTISV